MSQNSKSMKDRTNNGQQIRDGYQNTEVKTWRKHCNFTTYSIQN